MENLEDIKVGDIVVIGNRFGEQIHVVKSKTNLMYINSDTGRIFDMSGYEFGVSEADSFYLRKATAKEIEKFHKTIIKEELANSLRSFYWQGLSVEKMKKVYELINK